MVAQMGLSHCGGRASSLPRLIVCLLACRIPCLEADASEGITSATSPKTIYGLCATVADMVPFTVNNLWTVHCTLSHTHTYNHTPRQICALDTAARGLQPGKSPAHLVGFALNRGALQPQKEAHHVTHLTLINAHTHARSPGLCAPRSGATAVQLLGTVAHCAIVVVPCRQSLSHPAVTLPHPDFLASDLQTLRLMCLQRGSLVDTAAQASTQAPTSQSSSTRMAFAGIVPRVEVGSRTNRRLHNSHVTHHLVLHLAPREWNRTWLLQKCRRCVTCCR